MLAIRADQVIDGAGKKPLHNALILVKGERIVAVGAVTEVCIPPGTELLDMGAATVIPGMVDCHVHIHSLGGPMSGTLYQMDQISHSQGFLALRAARNAMEDMKSGFTTIRSLGSPAYVDVALRDAIKQRLIEGPRMRAAGQGLTITGGHMDPGVWAPEVSVFGRTGVGDGPWGCRKAAREQIKNGADVLKINAAVSRYSLSYETVSPFHQEMTYEEMSAICEEAHWAGLRVAAHAHGGQGITDAIRAGVDSFEHAPWLTEEQADMMAERGSFYVPTLITHTRALELGQDRPGTSPELWNWLLKVEEARWASLERARKAGVRIAVGTDAGFLVYHGENARELCELVRGGLTPMEAIVSATRIGAECLGMESDIGTIEPGKYADLVVIAGDPLTDISVLTDQTKIIHVFKAGARVK